MGLLPEFGITEAIRKAVTGKDAETPHNDMFYNNYKYNDKGQQTWPLDFSNASPVQASNPFTAPRTTTTTPSNSSAYKQGGSLYGGKTSTSKSSSNSASDYKSQLDAANKAAQKAQEAQRKREQGAINDAWLSEQQRYAGLEQNVRDQYNQANQQFDQYLPQFQQQVGNEKATQLGSLDQTQTQRQQESNHALAQVRQSLAELQRRQGAMLGATGGYSSSAAPAAGEMLSRQAFQGLGNVQEQRNNAMGQIDTQRKQVNDFYSNKLLEGEQKIQQNKNDLQKQFMSQLDAITNAKGASDAAKRQATIDAWKNYTNVSTQLNQQLVQNKISMDQWAQQAHAQLDAFGQQQNSLGAVSGIDAGAAQSQVQTNLGNGVPMSDASGAGYNTGAYDPNDPNNQFAYNTGAYDPLSSQYQYQGDAISNVQATPNIVQKYLNKSYA